MEAVAAFLALGSEVARREGEEEIGDAIASKNRDVLAPFCLPLALSGQSVSGGARSARRLRTDRGRGTLEL